MKHLLFIIISLLSFGLWGQTAEEDFHKYWDMGIAKYSSKDYKGAIDDFNKVIEFNPRKYADAYYHRGDCKAEIGDYKGAIEDYTKKIESAPNHSNSYSSRGGCKVKIGDY